MAEAGPRTSVIVVAYNSGPNLQRCVDALAAQTDQDFELILYDNASPDPGDRATRLPANGRLIQAEANTGFAGGVNRAVAASASPYIALVNPDAFAEPDWLERLVAAIESRDDVAAVGSLQVMADAPVRLDGLGDVMHASGLPYRGGFGGPVPEKLTFAEVFGPCAAAALYRRDAFEAVGGMDERFFCYVEDVDLAFRLRLAGWRCAVEPAARVAHVGSASTGRHSAFTVFHGARNRLWALVKNMPLALWPVVLPYHLAALSALTLAWLVKRPAVAGHIVRGTWAALRGMGPTLTARRTVQRARQASVWSIAKALTWSPLALAKRAADVRPLAREDRPGVSRDVA